MDSPTRLLEDSAFGHLVPIAYTLPLLRMNGTCSESDLQAPASASGLEEAAESPLHAYLFQSPALRRPTWSWFLFSRVQGAGQG